MRIGYGGILLEANPFSPFITGRAQFEELLVAEGTNLESRVRGTNSPFGQMVSTIEAAGHHAVALFAAHGDAGGPLDERIFDEFLASLSRSVQAALPLDAVLLSLHGAMISERQVNCDALQARAVRAAAPQASLGVVLDMHANCTQELIGAVDIVMGYKLYPHDDAGAIGRRVAELVIQHAAGKIRPVVAMRKARMLVPGISGMTYSDMPMADLLAAARALEEEEGILAASYFPCFSKFDGPDVGFRGVVIADGDARVADEGATRLAQMGWDRRHRLIKQLMPLDEAITVMAADDAASGLTVLVESADCAGGGAGGDSAVVASAMLEHFPNRKGAVIITDAAAASLAHRLGVGAVSEFKIGSSITPEFYGDPLQLLCEVEALSEGYYTYKGGMLSGMTVSMGPSALVKTRGLQILLCSIPTYEYAGEQLESVGVHLDQLNYAISKTVGNAAAGFPHAKKFLWLDTAGPHSQNQLRLPWKNIARPLFPFDDDFDNPIE
jgi:microcystin degradation protein MlrC